MRYKNFNYTTKLKKKFKQNKEYIQKNISGPGGVIVLVFFFLIIPEFFFIFLALFTSLIKGKRFDSQNETYF